MLTAHKFDPASLFPPFNGSLPAALRLSGERVLLEFHSLERDTYSTERFLSGALSNSNAVLRTIPVANGFPLHFEANSAELVRYCAKHALGLASDSDIA